MAEGFRNRVAAVFRERPGVWIDGRILRQVGGEYAWRTRVSECRRLLGMTIKNRVRRQPHSKVKASEYCYLPSIDSRS